MQIIPMRELKNTTEVERRCAEENGPVYVTKNGYGRLVVMDIRFSKIARYVGTAQKNTVCTKNSMPQATAAYTATFASTVRYFFVFTHFAGIQLREASFCRPPTA